jgi:hypothetical protein
MSSIQQIFALVFTLLVWFQASPAQKADGRAALERATPKHALSAPSSADRRREFLMFDSTFYKQKPDLRRYGLKPVSIVMWGMLWARGGDLAKLPDRDSVRRVAVEAGSSASITVLDIEHWPLAGNPAKVEESVRKYATLVQWFKEAAPTGKFGYYGVAPLRDYWASIQPIESPRYLAWQKQNDGMAPVARAADILCPSVYTFFEDQNDWAKYAVAQIREARRYAGGKPVYVFLWPQYHPTDKKLSGTYVSGEYWRMELEIARKYADGVIIWGGYQQNWNETAPWWLETRQFLQKLAS